MKKLIVNDSCIGCGACVAIDSEHFDFNEDGLSNVISENNLDTEELANAISSCPVGAIKLEGECNCEGKDKCCCSENCDCHNN